MTVWLSRELILAVHDEQLAEHGGATGIREEGLLESALARPLNRAAYGDPDIAELAAVFALGLIKSHPFIDGNKRTAYVALELFIRLNGLRFPISDADAVIMTLRLAANDIPEGEFITWVRSNVAE